MAFPVKSSDLSCFLHTDFLHLSADVSHFPSERQNVPRLVLYLDLTDLAYDFAVIFE